MRDLGRDRRIRLRGLFARRVKSSDLSQKSGVNGETAVFLYELVSALQQNSILKPFCGQLPREIKRAVGQLLT